MARESDNFFLPSNSVKNSSSMSEGYDMNTGPNTQYNVTSAQALPEFTEACDL